MTAEDSIDGWIDGERAASEQRDGPFQQDTKGPNTEVLKRGHGQKAASLLEEEGSPISLTFRSLKKRPE